MRRVLLLLSDAGPTGASTQARLALAGVPKVECATLTSNVRHAFDWSRLGSLRDRVRDFRPDVLHAVGDGAARTVALLKLPRVRWKPFPRWVVSGCDAPGGWLARRGTAGADAVLAYSPGEAERYAGFVKPERWHRIPPGVAPNPTTGVRTPVVAAVGNFDRWSGLKTAVWAFDLLKYVAPESHLLLIGDGPRRESVDQFGRALGYDDYRVRFAGLRSDVPAQLAATQAVWVTHERGGVSVALEAMAAGTPVIAMRTPDTAAVIQDGETGVLVPAGDRAALATVTAALLKRPDELRRLGENSRRAAAERFPIRALVDATAAVYDA